MKTEDTVALGR